MKPSTKASTISSFETDVGRKRKANQDRFLELPALGLFAIADGMGGHQGGETASELAIQTLQSFFEQQSLPRSAASADAGSVLKNAVLQANQIIYQTAQNQPQLKGMGTTLTAVWVGESNSSTPSTRRVWIAQVGDSRCYLIRGGHAFQITRDHSQMEDKIRARVFTKEEARTQKGRNVLTQAVGYESSVTVDIWDAEVTTGDRLLLCSDGLHGQMPETDWLKHACDADPLPTLTRSLITLALDRGGEDNTTVGIVEIT